MVGEILELMTTGRRSGAPRTIEIWFTRKDGWGEGLPVEIDPDGPQVREVAGRPTQPMG